MNDDLGTLEETAEGWQLRYVRQLDQPPPTVWRAFEEPELVEQWFPTTLEGDLSRGGALRFAFRDGPPGLRGELRAGSGDGQAPGGLPRE